MTGFHNGEERIFKRLYLKIIKKKKKKVIPDTRNLLIWQDQIKLSKERRAAKKKYINNQILSIYDVPVAFLGILTATSHLL